MSFQNPKPKKFHPSSKDLLLYLNEKCGRSFREVDANLSFISNRLNEQGVDVEGCKKMIDRQCAKWKGTDMEEYLRPETLFNKTKFDSYYSAKDMPIHARPSFSRSNGTMNEGMSEQYSFGK